MPTSKLKRTKKVKKRGPKKQVRPKVPQRKRDLPGFVSPPYFKNIWFSLPVEEQDAKWAELRRQIGSDKPQYHRGWHRNRKRVFEMENYQCQRCGKFPEKKDLRCHHIVPFKKSRSNDIDNLMTLCAKCHEIVHKRPAYNKHFFRP